MNRLVALVFLLGMATAASAQTTIIGDGLGRIYGDGLHNIYRPNPITYAHADILIDFETATAGDLISTNIMEACTRQQRPLGTWQIRYGNETNAPDVPQYPSNITIQAKANGYLAPVMVGNSIYSATGTRCMQTQMSNSYHNVSYNFNNKGDGGFTYRNVSIGAWITLPPGATNESKDVFVIDRAGAFCVMNTQHGTNFTVHTAAGKSPGIGVTTGVLYWVTMLSPSEGPVQLSVYRADGSLVGTNYLAQPNTNNGHSYISFGRVDDTGDEKTPGYVLHDNIMVDVTDATYPLGIASDAEHSSSFVNGYLIAEDWEDNRLPIGFTSSGSGITWSTNVNIDGPNALKISESSGDVCYDLAKDYTNIYTYAMVKPEALATNRYLQKFAQPGQATDTILGMYYGFGSNPALYGMVSNPACAFALTNGTPFHIWTEWEGGNEVRCYISTSATKPASPTISSASFGGAAYTNTMVRYIHLNDGGITLHDKFRVSTNAIGSNPQ